MATQTLRGSSIADGTLVTACDMSLNTTGGVEVTKTSTIAGTTNTWAEILSQGGASTSFTSRQAPTGNGWVFAPRAGTYDLGNWNANIRLSAGSTATSVVLGVYKLSSGVYSSIGTITITSVNGAVGTKTFPATSMPATTFGSSDFVYFDLWWQDTSSNVGGDNPVVYLSNSSSTGVANDMEIVTSNFTAGGTHRIICDGYGGMFV